MHQNQRVGLSSRNHPGRNDSLSEGRSSGKHSGFMTQIQTNLTPSFRRPCQQCNTQLPSEGSRGGLVEKNPYMRAKAR